MTKLVEITKKEDKEIFGIDVKVYKYGDCLVINSIDSCFTVYEVLANFGTDKLPIARYKHTSISRKDRYPTWEEIKEIKELLHGDVTVMQILPPKNYYVNLHDKCFHLWEIL
jgi:hypothetical protein